MRWWYLNNSTDPKGLYLENTRRWPNVCLMLGQRRRRWPNIEAILKQRFKAIRLHWVSSLTQQTQYVESMLV